MSAPSSIAASSLSFAVLLIAWPAAAQTNAAERNPDPPAAQEGAPAEAADSPDATAEGDAEEEGYVPEDEAAVEEEPAAEESAAPSAASLKANLRPRDSNQSMRVLSEVALGFLGVVIGGYAGSGIASGFVSPTYDMRGYVPMLWATSIGWMIGSGLFLPIAVWATGSMWKGKGQFLPTFVPAVIGTGIQVALSVALWLGSPGNYPLLPIIELVGGIATMAAGVVGYELSHSKALRGAVPVAALLRIKGGGGVALAWAF